jgi:diguanylate cyclase (GGDEF)-like protein
VYFSSFVLVMAVFVWTMGVALRRGSRAVKFQIAAWLPIMAVGVVRVGSNLGVTATPVDVNFEQHFAIVAEILITALGVVDRFMVLRRQRDNAWFETRLLEDAIERDALTGLTNRRALEQRFAALRDEGFTTMGVIDLDHFKAINDTHGHATGDTVLRAVAEALAPDDDTLAVRYGGEEFVLLLRGHDAAERAERRRAAIPARVAAAVEGLDRVVTASMGLVEQAPEVAARRDFAALFAQCDRLLYEAKHNGRNRTMSERLQVFTERRRQPRKSAA